MSLCFIGKKRNDRPGQKTTDHWNDDNECWAKEWQDPFASIEKGALNKADQFNKSDCPKPGANTYNNSCSNENCPLGGLKAIKKMWGFQ